MVTRTKAAPAAKPSTAVVSRAQVSLPAAVQESMNRDMAAFQERMSAPSGTRIAVTQDRKFRDPDGNKHDTISGVIVDFIAKRAWYEGAYNKDNIVPPNCFTLGFEPHANLLPSINAPDKQNEDCKTCQKGQFKSADNGKGKACKESYVLALLPPDAEEDTELRTLEISATGIKPFEKYVRDLARDYGKAPYVFVTEFSMDDNVDYASVRAGNPQFADTELIALAYSRREDAAKLLSVEPNVGEFDEKVVAARVTKRAPAKPASARK